MAREVWNAVRKQLGHRPLIEGLIDGESALYAERYLFQDIERTIAGLPCAGLVTQLGGGRVREGERDRWRSTHLPAQSLLVPAGVRTHWHYSTTIDFAVFYFLRQDRGPQQRLSVLARARTAPLTFADSLVWAAAKQLVDELQKGNGADVGFMPRLADVMLEQAFRVLTTPTTAGINPRHVHFSRLQAALNRIHEKPAADLSAEALARQAGVSLAHFRRIFHDAMKLPLHRYVHGVRLEQARKLLATTTLPISHIAAECGFSTQSHLSASFRAAHGSSPMDYRRAVR
ncbi:MAG: helix-turn-helix transcriptional regulator [Gammaproteobacteria bacterium]|nr:helix-turn-helix transcriptional regulator [Gammaproteobacteria bacterium]